MKNHQDEHPLGTENFQRMSIVQPYTLIKHLNTSNEQANKRCDYIVTIIPYRFGRVAPRPRFKTTGWNPSHID